MSSKKTPFFMTHHSPVGAWSSFTFGIPGKGAGLEHKTGGVNITTELFVALGRGKGEINALPFYDATLDVDQEMQQMEDAKMNSEDIPNTIQFRWNQIPEDKVIRTLTPCIDEFRAQDLSFKVYTPHPSVPDPESGNSLKYATAPGIILELEIDNTKSSKEAYGFIGFMTGSTFFARTRPVDWTSDNKLCGIAKTNEWALCAIKEDGKVQTLKDGCVAKYLEDDSFVIMNSGKDGGVKIIVPAGKKETLTCALGFFDDRQATEVINTKYYYTKHFNNVESVCSYLLENANQIKKESAEFDEECRKQCSDENKLELFSQAWRAYYANSAILLEENGNILVNSAEGGFFWRNTMDLFADHLSWELFRNDWIVRSTIDQYIDRYSYVDEVKFPDQPGKTFPGGISFTHDMGFYTTYEPTGKSGYERPHVTGCFSFMTTEELLNGTYAITGYALTSNNSAWVQKRLPVAKQIMESLENRDHYDPNKRDGLLKADSMMCGHDGMEITSYDCLDHSLIHAQGNVYIAIKTWGALVMLEKLFNKTGEKEYENRAQKMAQMCTNTLQGLFDKEEEYFPGNLYDRSKSKVIAAIEPLAVPIFCGLKSAILEYKGLLDLLNKHIFTCLKPGNCIDEKTGSLRLSSASTNTWPSKTSLCLYVLEEIFDIDINKNYPTLLPELLTWTQVAAKEETISDQISSDTKEVKGASYYPRIITSGLWVSGKKSL